MNRVLIRLLVTGVTLLGMLWYLEPLYAPPRSILRITPGTNDFVRWTVHSVTNEAVYQQVTLCADGRSEAVWTRERGDPDLPEVLARWHPRLDRQRMLYTFRSTNVLATATARNLFARLQEAGLVELVDRAAPPVEYVVVAFVIGDRAPREVRGPLTIEHPFDWDRTEWIRNLRWQTVVSPATTHPDLALLLRKTDIQLVDDEGRPVDRAP